MNASLPMITVLMPVYNGERHLAEAIDSILAQNYRDFEFIIINDGSTDGSESIILSYSDPRIRYVKNETNIRLIATLNKGLDLARGKYIARMDADDISLPKRFSEQLAFLEQNPDVGVVGTWFNSFGSVDSIVKYPTNDSDIKYMALYQCPFCHPSVMLRASTIRDNALRYSMDYPHAEDYEFWLQMARVSKLSNLPKVLFKYRIHQESISKKEATTQHNLSLDIRRMFFLEVGVKATDEELDLLRKMCYRCNDLRLSELKVVGRMLRSLIDANQRSRYMDQQHLANVLGNAWFNLCTNHAHLGSEVRTIYSSFNIVCNEKPQLVAMAKFYAKTVLKPFSK
jgi:glycosyltransferase involved in cell wall biosynthesis